MIQRKPSRPPAGPADLSASAFPVLESFFRGYLHEDFVSEHGTPEGALRAWRMDASAKEKELLDREAVDFLAVAGTLPFDTVRALVRREFGSAWLPSSLDRLVKLFAPRAARPRHP
jgi:hypothetical protein